AVAQAALQTPQANSTWNGDTYTLHHYVNLGLAAATERGLIVPNIKNAHELNQRQMAEDIQELTQRARDGKTQPTELADVTITITNIGVLGLDAVTPILIQGASGIISCGAIQQQHGL